MATLDQAKYRWRNDDGSETTATWKAPENTPVSGASDANVRLRIETHHRLTGSITFTPKLQYNLNSAGWNDVTGASAVARSAASGNFADNAATTQQLGVDAFVAGKMDEGDGTFSTGVTLDDAGAGISTDHELCFQIRSADVAAGDIIEFRFVPTSGGTYTDYTNIAVWNVPGGANASKFWPFFD